MDFMQHRLKMTANLSVMSASIILILKLYFRPESRLAGGLHVNIGIKAMPRKRQKPVLIMHVNAGYSTKFILLQRCATIVQSM